MSEPWIGPPDGALRWEREGHSDRPSGVLEPSEAAPAGPDEGAMSGPTADPPEPDRAPEEILEEGPTLAGHGPPGPDTGSGNFEERLRRLEDALAQLQDLKGMETRVAERVAHQIQGAPPGGLPAGALWEAGKKVLASASAAAGRERPEPARASRQGLMGFFWETFVEMRAMAYMFVDPRYRMSWWGRGAALVLFALLLFSGVWVPFANIDYVGYGINKAADLVLAYFLFKTLSREARRYRELAPDLPQQLR